MKRLAPLHAESHLPWGSDPITGLGGGFCPTLTFDEDFNVVSNCFGFYEATATFVDGESFADFVDWEFWEGSGLNMLDVTRPGVGGTTVYAYEQGIYVFHLRLESNLPQTGEGWVYNLQTSYEQGGPIHKTLVGDVLYGYVTWTFPLFLSPEMSFDLFITARSGITSAYSTKVYANVFKVAACVGTTEPGDIDGGEEV